MRMRIGMCHDSQNNTYDHNKIPKNFPFGFQKSHCTFSNIIADLFHAVGTGILLAYPVKFTRV